MKHLFLKPVRMAAVALLTVAMAAPGWAVTHRSKTRKASHTSAKKKTAPASSVEASNEAWAKHAADPNPPVKPPAIRLAATPLIPFASGITAVQEKKFDAARANLTRMRGQEPKISDYVDYYLAFSEDGLRDSPAVLATLGDLHEFRDLRSPLLAKATILEARSLMAAGQKKPEILNPAIDALRSETMVLSEPEGDFALALAYDAIGDGIQAATYYQRVYFLYPNTQMAAEASTAMDRLKQALGAKYPAALPEMMLERGARWIDAKEYSKAQAEFEWAEGQMKGQDRDRARVGIGAAKLASGDTRGALAYLNSLNFGLFDFATHNEADAERLYYVEECHRKVGEESAMASAIDELDRKHERSVWRLKALIAAGNHYLMTNEKSKYEPLFRAAWQTFPSDSATAYCHWKIAFDSYMADKSDAHDLLKEQVERYPQDFKAGTALYFLGRQAERSEDFGSARAYYERLNTEYPNFYYALLARDRMQDKQVAGAAADQKVTDWLEGIEFPKHADYSTATPTEATKSHIERARLLVEAGAPDFAETEVRFAGRLDGQPHLLALELSKMDTAVHVSLRHMKVLAPDYLSTAIDKAPPEFWRMLYPLPYRGQLVASARKQNIDPYMVAAVIRQESEFNPAAHSYANAYGLTQIEPSTGKMLARAEGLRYYTTTALYQPGTNLNLGSLYLRQLLDQCGGSWEHTLAAYNAGPGRLKQWLAWGKYREPAEFVESIPITQTREYIQAVLRNAAVYRQVYGPSSAMVADPEPEPDLPPTPPLTRVSAPAHAKGAKVGHTAVTQKRNAPPTTKVAYRKHRPSNG